MVCSHVGGDNPRALVNGLSPVQVTNHGMTVLYQLHVQHITRYFMQKLVRVV